MLEEIHTVHTLNKQGKLDSGLRFRLTLFTLLAAIFGVEVLNNIFTKGVVWYSLVVPFIVGFLFGVFVLARINRIQWDKKKRMMTVGRIDFLSIIILLIYWAIRFDADVLLSPFYHNIITITAATLSLVFGIMLGRLSGVFRKVHAVHTTRKKK